MNISVLVEDPKTSEVFKEVAEVATDMLREYVFFKTEQHAILTPDTIASAWLTFFERVWQRRMTISQQENN